MLLDKLATLAVNVYACVEESAAVTVTVTVLFPATRPVLPVTATVASGLVAKATTVTLVAPTERFTVPPAVTASPLAVIEARVLSEDLATSTVTS